MKTIFTFVCAITLFTACEKSGNGTLEGRWKLTFYHNLTSGVNEPEPANIARSIILNFSDDGSNGRITGHTVTNTVTGDYQLPGNNKITITGFGGTKVGEPDWGRKFWLAMQSVHRYQRNNRKLTLFFNTNTESMEFDLQ